MRPLSLGCLLAFLAAGPAAAQSDDKQACPEGTYRVATNNPVEPFHCRSRLDTDTPYITMTPNYKLRTCPKGRHAVETPGLGSGRRYRCVPDKKGQADPSAAPALPARQAAGPAKGGARSVPFSAPTQYVRVTKNGAFQAEVPQGWQVSDAWDEETPGFYVEFDTGRQGRQVQLVVSKIEKSQETYASVEQAVARDRELQNAAEDAPGRVAGFPARFTSVRGASRTAYVPINDEDYFTLTYAAPDDLYAVYLPVFQRLLSTLRIAKDQRR